MDPAEARRAIRERMNEIKRKKIWERTLKIVKTLGIIHHDVHDCYTKTTGYFSIENNGLKLQIKLDSTGQFAQNTILNIYINEKLVFDAEEIDYHPEEKKQARLIKRKNEPTILITLYHPGEWTELLSINTLKNIIKKREIKEKGEKQKKPDPNRLLSVEEVFLAKNLGIN